MRYFKDDKDGYYVLTDGAAPNSNWVEITLDEYLAANPEYIV